MRDTIKGAIIGAFVAAGITVLLAQTTPSWTSPRTWATDDLLTASQFNAQIRDNLLNIRGFAVCAENGTTGTSSAGTILYGDCRWAAGADTFDIHDVVTTAATIVDADLVPFSDEGTAGDPMRHTTAANFASYVLTDIPNTALSTSTGSMSGVGSGTNVTLGEYVLSKTITTANANQFVNVDGFRWSGTIPTDAKDRFYITFHELNAGSVTIIWRRLAASDRPAVWVLLIDGDVVTISVSEDPPADEDNTTAPFGLQQAYEDDDGTVIPAPTGQSIVNIGLPSDTILSTLMASRASALATWQAYLVSRGWVTNPPTTYTATIALVSDRYAPAARFWAMREIAKADDIGEAAAYLTLLQVGPNDTWELAIP